MRQKSRHVLPNASNKVALLGVLLVAGLFSGVSQADYVPFDLSGWSHQDLFMGCEPTDWAIESGNVAHVTNNSCSSVLYSDFNVDPTTSRDIEGYFTNSGFDGSNFEDDQMGFVIGYNDRSNFYMFQWKGSETEGSLTDGGMHLRRVTRGTDFPNAEDLEGPVNTYNANLTPRSLIVHENDDFWAHDEIYNFLIEFTVTGFILSLFNNDVQLVSWAVDDPKFMDLDDTSPTTFNPGKFGFFTSHNEDTYFQAGYVVPVPAAAWLFASALGLLGWARRRR